MIVNSSLRGVLVYIKGRIRPNLDIFLRRTQIWMILFCLSVDVWPDCLYLVCLHFLCLWILLLLLWKAVPFFYLNSMGPGLCQLRLNFVKFAQDSLILIFGGCINRQSNLISRIFFLMNIFCYTFILSHLFWFLFLLSLTLYFMKIFF